MRAPPEQQTMTTGSRAAMARSMPRVIFSPTTTPMLPPMKPYSIDAMTVGMPSMRAGRRRSRRPSCPVLAIDAFSRALYGLVSVKPSGSVETRSLSYSVHVAVEQHAQPLGGVDAEVVRALRADAEVGREILVVDDLRAARDT